MADEGDLDEGRMDFEALQDQAQVNREIEALGIDQEKFEDIQREFKQFLQEIIGN